MAPRKNCDSSNKVVRKRVVKEKLPKPKLKTPTTIKVKIPLVQKWGPDSSTVKLTKRQLTVQRKIELANEVAAAQLNQDFVIEEEPPPEAKPQRGRKRSIQNQTPVPQQRQQTISEFFNKDAPEPPEVVGPIKSLADSTMNVKRGPRRAKTVKNMENTNVTIKKTIVQNTKKPVLRRRGRQGKVKEAMDPPEPVLLTPPSDKPANDIKSKAETIHSRTNSINSNSNLSWTRDISTSSTTTCVTVSSNDIVRFDKKIPFVQLTAIDDIIKRKNTIESSSDSDSDSTDADCPDIQYDNIEDNSLNLSVSSLSDGESLSPEIKKYNFLMKQLDINVKSVDLEFVHWMGSNNDAVEDIQTYRPLSNSLDRCMLERNIKKLAENVLHVLNITENDKEAGENDGEINVSGAHRSKVVDVATDNENLTNVFTESADKNNEPVSEQGLYYTDTCSDNINYTSFDQNVDDDDTLSLFAESITDLESFKMNTSLPSVSNVACTSVSNMECEEYVPTPVIDDQRRSPERCTPRYTYKPTKINPSSQANRPFCEKQSADSTSLNIDNYNQFEAGSKNDTNYIETGPFRHFNPYERPKNHQPKFINSLFKPVPGIKSVVYKGVCFYNLISGCKMSRCRYPHYEPEVAAVKQTLVALSEDQFIPEYMLMRNWPSLRRKYGLCYVEECSNRQLTRVLVEMGIDFVSKANLSSPEDTALKVAVLEIALMHLNMVELDCCEDLLITKLYCATQSIIYYDVLMQAIADTQNFARFKIVFVKLVVLVVKNGGSFDLEVVTKILERICILPCEEGLARSMLLVMQHTDRRIFQNSKLPQFELLLNNLESDVLTDYLSMKTVLHSLPSPQLNITLNNSINPPHELPDTTNMDNLNKSKVEPIITRTIDLKRSVSNTSFGEFTIPKIPPHHSMKNSYQWRNPYQVPGPRNAGAKKNINQRHVMYTPAPVKSPHGSGMEF